MCPLQGTQQHTKWAPKKGGRNQYLINIHTTKEISQCYMLYNGLSLSIITADAMEKNDIPVSNVHLTINLETTGKVIWRQLVFKEDKIMLWLNFYK